MGPECFSERDTKHPVVARPAVPTRRVPLPCCAVRAILASIAPSARAAGLTGNRATVLGHEAAYIPIRHCHVFD